MNDFDILTALVKDAIRECQLMKLPWHKRVYYRLTGKPIPVSWTHREAVVSHAMEMMRV